VQVDTGSDFEKDVMWGEVDSSYLADMRDMVGSVALPLIDRDGSWGLCAESGRSSFLQASGVSCAPASRVTYPTALAPVCPRPPQRLLSSQDYVTDETWALTVRTDFRCRFSTDSYPHYRRQHS
jgi:hypothetical protein